MHTENEPLSSPLPREARSAINRCNLPAVVLGSLTYQKYPSALELIGTRLHHADLFRRLDPLRTHEERARQFVDYMAVMFRLTHPEDVGAMPGAHKRTNANYLRIVRGWAFDANSKEAAVLKFWVESRFGLLARYHHQPLRDGDGEARERFLRDVSSGLYATNALEAQLDLLYTYCQYELQRQSTKATHQLLYRGVNALNEHEILRQLNDHRYHLLLNNVSSFTTSRERADEFGDRCLRVRVPLPKVCVYGGLLPRLLEGEDEVVVLGGVYSVDLLR